ncbi:MAG: hypothetical protein H6807_13035 [Planctomycetes bacterium]|nr:hypothetical protein [Planctomycetota bacterium]
MRTTKSAILLLGLVLVACGEGAGKRVVITRREPRSLLEQGSALTEEEAARRKAAEEENAREVKARQDLFKEQNRLAGARSAAARVDALGRLAALGSAAEPALEQIEPCLADEDADVRLAALEARLAIRDEGGDGLVLRALDDEDGRVRRGALEFWAERHAEEKGPFLKGLHDDDAGVQYAAISGLVRSRATLPVAVLEGIAARLDEMSGPVAKVAFDLLLERRKELGDFAAALEVLLDHRDQTLRLLVIERAATAGIFAKGLALKIVQTAVEDPEPAVRVAAYRWLRERAPVAPPAFDPEADDGSRWEGRQALLDWQAALPD